VARLYNLNKTASGNPDAVQFRDELLNFEIIYTLIKAQIVIEQ